jgi:hypothetical protein
MLTLFGSLVAENRSLTGSYNRPIFLVDLLHHQMIGTRPGLPHMPELCHGCEPRPGEIPQRVKEDTVNDHARKKRQQVTEYHAQPKHCPAQVIHLSGCDECCQDPQQGVADDHVRNMEMPFPSDEEAKMSGGTHKR